MRSSMISRRFPRLSRDILADLDMSDELGDDPDENDEDETDQDEESEEPEAGTEETGGRHRNLCQPKRWNKARPTTTRPWKTP
jgi:cobalamin biosynthesis protein CobT